MSQFVYLDYSFFTLYAVGMEPHPIPQNVTSFQFHLVGDMTLKQFMYLATGSTIAYVIFVFLSPIYPVIAWPAILISAALGVAFAFLPIAQRPLDSWLKAFLKAVYSPTKRVWKKNNKTYQEDPLFNSRLVTYLSSLQPVLEKPTAIPTPTAVAQAPPLPKLQELPSSDELEKTVDLARQAQHLQLKIIQSERALNQIKSEATAPTATAVDYSEQVNKIITDLHNLVNQASQIRQQLDVITKPELPKAEPIPLARLKEKVKVIIPTKPKQAQLALTTFPNVINGIVKDPLGNYLEGAIAVIYDREGLPVRALKTNKLGQFTGSTPLPNGTYTLAIEKDNFAFDVLQIELGGEILPPLIIISR